MTSRTVRSLLVVAAVVGMSLSPAGAQPTDLSSYGLLALQELRSRGVTSQGVRHFGTNAADGVTHFTGRIDAPTSDVAGNCVAVVARASASGAVLFADQAARPVCTVKQPFTPPFAAVADLLGACGFPSPFPACGGESITVEHGQTRIVTPGSYGNVVVRGGPNPGSLVFDGVGAYPLCELTVGRHG